jgi:hypothetical protein
MTIVILKKATYGDFKEMLSPFGQEVLVGRPEAHGLENVSRSPISLKHRMIDHVPQV